MSNKVKIFFKYYLPLFLWMGVIFCFSSIRGGELHGARDFWFYFQRKGAHIFEYTILTFLIARVVLLYIDKKKDFIKALFLVGLLSLLYAVSDELHQTFVFGREGKILDVGIDLTGILLTIFGIWFLTRKPKNK